MKLEKTLSIDPTTIKDLNFDLFLCCSGYEKRSNYIASSYKINATKKIVLGFDSFKEKENRINNDIYYKNENFEYLGCETDGGEIIAKILRESICIENREVNILVDYSSMTRIWYSTIISFFKFNDKTDKNINIYFIYSYSLFTPPSNERKRNIHIGPIDNFSSLSIPDKPTALIIGLGHEKERAFGLTEYLDAETFIFYNDSYMNEKYFESVTNANSLLLKETKQENIFEYSIFDLQYTETLLYSLCKSLLPEYRIVLAPTGPKPFTLISLLVSLRLDNIDVWRISAGNNRVPSESKPSDVVSCYKVIFS